MSVRDLLFELRTEELPPRTLLTLSNALTEGMLKGLDAAGVPHGKAHGFANAPASRGQSGRLRRICAG